MGSQMQVHNNLILLIGKSMSNWLREAEVDIVDNSECKDIFRDMKIKNVEITPKVICAGNWRKNTCQVFLFLYFL